MTAYHYWQNQPGCSPIDILTSSLCRHHYYSYWNYSTYHTEHMSCHTQDFPQASVELTTSYQHTRNPAHALQHLITHCAMLITLRQSELSAHTCLLKHAQAMEHLSNLTTHYTSQRSGAQRKGLHNLQATQHLQASPHPNFRRETLHLHRLSVLQSHCKNIFAKRNSPRHLHHSHHTYRNHFQNGSLPGTWLTATCIITTEPRAEPHPPASLHTLYLKQ